MPRTRNKFRLIILSFTVSVVLMVIKFVAYWLTNSNAVLTDALESIVNVVASGFAFYSIYLSSLPRDSNHPYGHGKIEFFSAGLEGALILLAGVFIFFHSVKSLLSPQPLHDLGLGLVLVLLTTAVNYAVGWILRREGRISNSLTLSADGKHLILDAQSSLVLVIGIGVIYLTGWQVLDSLLSMGFAVYIVVNGTQIARQSVAGLMDEVDKGMLGQVVEVLKTHRLRQWIDIHNLRVQKYGADLHIDCHLTLPNYWTLLEVHETVHELEEILRAAFSSDVEIFVHTDPCIPPCCPHCHVENCPIREAPFTKEIDWTPQNLSLNQKLFLEKVND
ncbi:MAG: cation diffusion facilitator family transporter [Cytophagaceae bacterium]|nr:cation diffusion facilitator family transporter [Cytophagaceae bacterium]